MNREQIDKVANVLRQRGRDITPGDVALAATSIDVDAISSDVDARVSWEVWDKSTPINGVEPDYFLNRDDYAGGEVYLVRLDGRVVMVQPHVPGVDGLEPITPNVVRRLAEEQKQQIVEDMSFIAVVDAVEASVAGATEVQTTTPVASVPEVAAPPPVIVPEVPEVTVPRSVAVNPDLTPAERAAQRRSERKGAT